MPDSLAKRVADRLRGIRTREDFILATGRNPEKDDLDRINCKHAGKPGHRMCGWCRKHNKPKYECACWMEPAK